MDYYEILGVEKDASANDIKKAFRQIARECHPDVTGDDPKAAERFKEARLAYETLIDAGTRARYDRRGQRRNFAKGSFFDSFYRSMGGDPEAGWGRGRAADGRPADSPFAEGMSSNQQRPKKTTPGAHDAGGVRGAGRKAAANPANDLNLDDLFNGFGDFGFGNQGAAAEPPPQPKGPPTRGEDIEIELEVPAIIARDGGTVTASYGRMQRGDWRTGAGGSRSRVQDIADVRLIPQTKDGEVLRERGLGDAGENGGPYGDLVIRVRIVGRAPDRARAEPPRAARTPTPVRHEPVEPEPPPAEKVEEPKAPPPELVVDVSMVEALLGGRVEMTLPDGARVRLVIPPGTSSHARLRLKGKGPGGADLHVAVRVVIPRALDDESRKLVEEFARLNPGNPRSD